MKVIFRKILIILFIAIPVFTDPGCKKQPKCGCDGDMLFELDREPAKVYFDENSAQFSPVNNPYATYYFCNPEEMYSSKLKDYSTGDLLLVSGYVYWNCNFLYASSNYSYSYYYYKVYDILVTDVTTDLYGKK